MRSSKREPVTFNLSKHSLAIVKFFAEEDFRTLDEEFAWILEQERKRRISNITTKYTVVLDIKLESFEQEINLYIEKGWRPLGGICVNITPDEDEEFSPHLTYYQAMIIID